MPFGGIFKGGGRWAGVGEGTAVRFVIFSCVELFYVERVKCALVYARPYAHVFPCSLVPDVVLPFMFFLCLFFSILCCSQDTGQLFVEMIVFRLLLLWLILMLSSSIGRCSFPFASFFLCFCLCLVLGSRA